MTGSAHSSVRPVWPAGADAAMAWTARYVAFGCAIFAALAWREAATLESWGWDGPGPGLMPQALAVLVGIAALAVMAAPGDASAEPEGGARPYSNTTFLAYALSMIGVAVALPHLGYVLPLTVATVVMLRFGESTSWTEAARYAVLLSGGVVLLFGTALGVPFPSGVAERALYSIGLVRGG